MEESDQEETYEDVEETPLVPGTTPPASASSFELHRAVWDGDVESVKILLADAAHLAQVNQLDPHGNTPLHLAAIRGHLETATALVEAGAPAMLYNSRGWLPLHEAVQGRHKELAHYLATAARTQMKAEAKKQRVAMMAQLSKLPDFTMQLKWELSSSVPGLGMVVRRYAPHDTYTIWKQGSKLRVDGSLMGVKEDSMMGGGGGGILPEWDRGHYSLIYSGNGDSATVKFINHTDKEWLDLKALHKKMSPDQQAAIWSKVDTLLASVQSCSGVLEAGKMKSRDFRFDPVKGWLGRPLVEDMDGWKSKVYEASLSLVKLKKYKLPFPLPPTATWEQYLSTTMPTDLVLEVPTNPLTSAIYSQGKLEAKEAQYEFQEAACREARRIVARRGDAQPTTTATIPVVATAADGAAQREEGALSHQEQSEQATPEQVLEQATPEHKLHGAQPAAAAGVSQPAFSTALQDEDAEKPGEGAGKLAGDNSEVPDVGWQLPSTPCNRDSCNSTAEPGLQLNQVGSAPSPSAPQSTTSCGNTTCGGDISADEVGTSITSTTATTTCHPPAAPSAATTCHVPTAPSATATSSSSAAVASNTSAAAQPRAPQHMLQPTVQRPTVARQEDDSSPSPPVTTTPTAPTDGPVEGISPHSDATVAYDRPCTPWYDAEEAPAPAGVPGSPAEDLAGVPGSPAEDLAGLLEAATSADADVHASLGALGLGIGKQTELCGGEHVATAAADAALAEVTVQGVARVSGTQTVEGHEAPKEAAIAHDDGTSGTGVTPTPRGPTRTSFTLSLRRRSKTMQQTETVKETSQGETDKAPEADREVEGPPKPPVFKPAKRMSGRCWMAEDFPLSLHDLLPLLEAIGTANKYVSKVAKFMSAYGDRGEFPVKVVVPLLFTLNMNLTFKKFKLLPPTPTLVPTGLAPQAESPCASTVTPETATTSTVATAQTTPTAPKKKFWSSFLSSSSSHAGSTQATAPTAASGADSSSSKPKMSKGFWSSSSSSSTQTHRHGPSDASKGISTSHSSRGLAPGKRLSAVLPPGFFDVPEDYRQDDGEPSGAGSMSFF